MSMDPGNAACTTGLSKRIFDSWSASPDSGFSVPLSSDQAKAVKALCYAVAQSVYDEITQDAITSPDNNTIT